MRIFHLSSVLCVLGAIGISAPSAAQPKLAPTSSAVAATDRARALHREGAVLFEQKKYEDAYVAFVAAWALKRHPQIAANLADCEVKLGKYRDAAEHFTFMVRDPNGESQPEEKQEAQRRLKEVQAKIGTLVIAVNVGSAEVLLDGKPIGMSPLQEPVFVDPGSHTIEARKDGYVSAKTTTVVAAASSSPLTIELQSAEQREGKSTGLIVGGAALSAVLLGSGIAFLAVSGGKATEADLTLAQLKSSGITCLVPPQPGSCEQLLSLRRGQGTFHNVGVPMLVGGGLGAIATAAYALWPRATSEPTTGLQVLPAIGPGSAGMWLTGSF